MKNQTKKMILLILILGLTFILAYTGAKSDKISNLIDSSYQILMIVMFSFIILIYCLRILPKDLKRIKIKRIMTKEDYNALESFIDITEPDDDNIDFPTFFDISSAAINITLLQKEDLGYIRPLEFTAEEKENILKYRNQNTDDSKYLCYYYDKCLEIITIVNKYYDSEGKLKNK